MEGEPITGGKINFNNVVPLNFVNHQKGKRRFLMIRTGKIHNYAHTLNLIGAILTIARINHHMMIRRHH